MFVNAGGKAIMKEGNMSMNVESDRYFEGGDVLRTDESIIDGGDMAVLYQSARFGNFSYRIGNLSPGDYLVDLHFAEIVNANGPKGMRVFDVFMQEEKVLLEIDIYSIVGANKPLQVVDVRVSVGMDEVLLIRFDGACGSPIVNGICIKNATNVPESLGDHGHLICNGCGTEIEITPAQDKLMRMKSMAKCEKRIKELKIQCQLKTDECYEAWMSLTAANDQLEKVRMGLDNKCFQNLCLDQALEKQAAKLKDVASLYERDKRLWIIAMNELERKILIWKEEHSQLAREAHECASSVPQLNKMVSTIQVLVAQYDDLKLKFSEEQAKRKKLYNQVQEAKGKYYAESLIVFSDIFCYWCRPLSKEEASAGHAMVVDFSAAKDGELGILTGGSTKKIFKFDRVYSPRDEQVDVFADASPLVTSVLDGYNVCIFAYGQTGTGKTFTMEGTQQNRGVNYRTLELLFKTAKERKETFTYSISVSALEVYNEQIRDLLDTSPTSKKLEIRQASEGFHHVPGLTEAKIENIKEVWDVLHIGSNARAVGSNNVNEHSSRSHCMLCISVKAKNLINGECTKSKLWLVDLAGSERLAKTEVQGERLKEAQNINRSLSALGDVISSLATKSGHIPYRNSKLTHLLQDSLGGDSKTLMFLQISPSEQDLGETLSSLNFASRVRGVELSPARKQIDTSELQKVKMMLEKTKQELRSKDDVIQRLEENFQNLEVKAKGNVQLCKNQQGKINELESQLESKTQLCRQLEKQLLQVSEGMKGKEEICSNVQRKVKELENKLKEHDQSENVTALHHKVRELENRLKARTQEFEVHSGMLQQKIAELEEKLRKKEEYATAYCFREMPVTTPYNATVSRVETTIDDMDPPSLRILNHNGSNRAMNTESESDLLKGTNSLRELRRKRQTQWRGSENNILLSASFLEKNSLTAESNKPRHVDSSRAIARITRSTKTASTAQRASFFNSKTNRDQVAGGKESGSKLKIWLR
ncbi:kinesin-like protein KIN-14R [Citrus sinensis]|uniref:Kinesin-like protein KIN-14R n=2 Tax=Citrus sinensis TaxID=2711 RepID=A0ACB8KNZ0_CITSI|nr:kinesin-like protein KIN-14R [Citrus sinensis]